MVSDRHQHRGIGTQLMKSLMDAARAHGLSVMEGTVLSTNKDMLQLMSALGFTTKRVDKDPSVVAVERQL